MGTITGKLTLTSLQHVIRKSKTKDGEEIDVLIIPIKKNNLFHSVEKGNVYLDVICFDQVNDDYKQTHAVKQSFAKDTFTKEELKDKPYLGHLNTKFGGGGEAANNADGPGADGKKLDETDDLPF